MFFISSLPAQVVTTFWVSMADVTICRQHRRNRTLIRRGRLALHAVGRTADMWSVSGSRQTDKSNVDEGCTNLHVVLVNVLEALCFLWQLLDNVAAREHGLHVHPHVLHDEPLLNDLGDRAELDNPALDLVSEGGAVPAILDRKVALLSKGLRFACQCRRWPAFSCIARLHKAAPQQRTCWSPCCQAASGCPPVSQSAQQCHWASR